MFSLATKCDSRENENAKEMIVGIIPGHGERLEADQMEERGEEQPSDDSGALSRGTWEEVIVGTIHCRVEQEEQLLVGEKDNGKNKEMEKYEGKNKEVKV